MQFTLDENMHEQAVVENADELNVIAKLLGTRPKQVEMALCYRVVAARGEVLEKGHNDREAYHGRDALAKVQIYYIRELYADLVFLGGGWKWAEYLSFRVVVSMPVGVDGWVGVRFLLISCLLTSLH